MPLESATYIADLVATNPVHTDPIGQADSHLRLIKAVLQSQFPNLGEAAVTATAAQLNSLATSDPLPTTSGAFIKMWSGSVANIPSNYHLCDGSTVTIAGVSVTLPDLRSRFIIGSDGDAGTYPHGATGGSLAGSTSTDGAHTHTGNTGSTVLDQTQIPAHTHTATVTDPGHSHTYTSTSITGGDGSGGNVTQPHVFTDNTSTSLTGITVSNSSTGGGLGHTHTISSDGGHAHTAPLPAYYALCFVARIS